MLKHGFILNLPPSLKNKKLIAFVSLLIFILIMAAVYFMNQKNPSKTTPARPAAQSTYECKWENLVCYQEFMENRTLGCLNKSIVADRALNTKGSPCVGADRKFVEQQVELACKNTCAPGSPTIATQDPNQPAPTAPPAGGPTTKPTNTPTPSPTSIPNNPPSSNQPLPSSTPTPLPTSTPKATMTPTPTLAPIPTATSVPIPTATITLSPTVASIIPTPTTILLTTPNLTPTTVPTISTTATLTVAPTSQAATPTPTLILPPSGDWYTTPLLAGIIVIIIIGGFMLIAL